MDIRQVKKEDVLRMVEFVEGAAHHQAIPRKPGDHL